MKRLRIDRSGPLPSGGEWQAETADEPCPFNRKKVTVRPVCLSVPLLSGDLESRLIEVRAKRSDRFQK